MAAGSLGPSRSFRTDWFPLPVVMIFSREGWSFHPSFARSRRSHARNRLPGVHPEPTVLADAVPLPLGIDDPRGGSRSQHSLPEFLELDHGDLELDYGVAAKAAVLRR